MTAREEMDRLAATAVDRYATQPYARLACMARQSGHAEVCKDGCYRTTVDCMFDSGGEGAVRIMASVSRDTLLSSMFPRTKAGLVVAPATAD